MSIAEKRIAAYDGGFAPRHAWDRDALFEGLDLPALGYRVTESTATDLTMHVVIGRE